MPRRWPASTARSDRRRPAARDGQAPAVGLGGTRVKRGTGKPWRTCLLERDRSERKAEERRAFLADISLIGGLIIAAVDTEGKPSLGWRGRRAAHKVSEASRGAAGRGRDGRRAGRQCVAERSATACRSVPSGAAELAHVARERGAELADVARERGAELAEVARERGAELADVARERGAELAEVARERAPELAETARERGSGLADVARERAEELADTARKQVRSNAGRRWH